LTPAVARITALAALVFGASAAWAAPFQFEVIGASSDWVVLRENMRAKDADTAACKYPGLEPSEQVGVRVRFVKLSDAAKHGRLLPLEPASDDSVLPVYDPAPEAAGCTTAAAAAARWKEIHSRAEGLGVTLAEKAPSPAFLGAPVPASSCVLLPGEKHDTKACHASYAQKVAGGPIKIAVALAAVPEAPELKTCQFVGQRLEAAIQVDGLDFGTVGGSAAPGGFADHYDCRAQEFAPLRLYRLEGTAVLLGGFRGTNMADRAEHPFVIVFPTQPAP
jgi:hypothetical protein